MVSSSFNTEKTSAQFYQRPSVKAPHDSLAILFRTPTEVTIGDKSKFDIDRSLILKNDSAHKTNKAESAVIAAARRLNSTLQHYEQSILQPINILF